MSSGSCAGVDNDRLEEQLRQWISTCDIDELVNDVRGELENDEGSYNVYCVRGGKF